MRSIPWKMEPGCAHPLVVGESWLKRRLHSRIHLQIDPPHRCRERLVSRTQSWNRWQLFPDDRANEHFLELLKSLPARFDLRIHAFVLMGNHYHLQIETLKPESLESALGSGVPPARQWSGGSSVLPRTTACGNDSTRAWQVYG